MHRLVTRAIEHFLSARQGPAFWAETAARVAPSAGAGSIEMFGGQDIPLRLMAQAAGTLERAAEDLWEDLGTHLVTHPDMETIRRLLRFGGASFEDFLWSLDTLESRVKLALPDQSLPSLSLQVTSDTACHLTVTWPGFYSHEIGHLMVGVLRAIADDYGALVILECPDPGPERGAGSFTIAISVLDESFAEGRSFYLGHAGAA